MEVDNSVQDNLFVVPLGHKWQSVACCYYHFHCRVALGAVCKSVVPVFLSVNEPM